MSYDYTREELIDICERALKLQRPENWCNRDSPSAFQKTATLLAYLKNAEKPSFDIVTDQREYIETDEETLWIEVDVDQMEFQDFPKTFYLPHGERLEKAEEKDRDWY